VPVKHDLLGVDAGLLDREGAVHPDVCEAMARGAGRLLHADVGLATTGVAGPESHGGKDPGTVYICVALTADTDGDQGPATVRGLQLDGGRDEVRRATVTAVLALLTGLLSGGTGPAAARPEPPPPLLPT